MRRFFPGTPTATVVHDLAVKGAETVVRERHNRNEAIERLAALSIERHDLIDWGVLERVDEVAWRR